MERIWAPWRIEYILAERPCECIFCDDDASLSDRDRLILYRTSLSIVMLNRYPYTNGHLMVAPSRHIASLDDLSEDEILDIFRATRLSRTILQQEASPQGYNIGINLGKTAGAGVEEHLHVHIVPRWHGDTNFMAVVDDVRVVPEGLLATYDRLRPFFIAEEIQR